MRRWDYIPVILIAVSISLLIGLPRINENKSAWETQHRFNEKVIEWLDTQAETNDLVLDYLKTISKKPGQ